MYEYQATVDRVVDGDTVDLIVDLGFGIMVKERFRLEGINAPESRTRNLTEKALGVAATEFLETMLTEMNGPLVITTKKDKKGKFGRYLCTLWMDRGTDMEMNINHEMVSCDHAVFKEY